MPGPHFLGSGALHGLLADSAWFQVGGSTLRPLSPRSTPGNGLAQPLPPFYRWVSGGPCRGAAGPEAPSGGEQPGGRVFTAQAQCALHPQYEPIVTKGNEALVHHMEVFQCATEFESVPRFSGPCDSKMKPDRLNYCRHVLAAWALGAKVRALCSRVTSRASSRVFGVPRSSTPLCPPLLYLKGPTKGHWGCS